jgi:hypothetical protein
MEANENIKSAKTQAKLKELENAKADLKEAKVELKEAKVELEKEETKLKDVAATQTEIESRSKSRRKDHQKRVSTIRIEESFMDTE